MNKFQIKWEESSEGFSYDKIVFQYFPSRADIIIPKGFVTLQQFIDKHRKPKKKMVEVFDKIQKASNDGDEKLKSKLKQEHLFYFVPSVILKTRCYSDVINFTGIMVCEYDKLGKSEADALKTKIFNKFESCICAYSSPSGTGVKFLFRIPVVSSVEEYKEYYYGISHYLSQIDGYDISNQSCVLPLFISMDENMLVRPQEEVKVWVLKGTKVGEAPKSTIDSFEAPEDVTDKEIASVYKFIDIAFDKVEEEQEGHTIITKASLISGGYIAGGYVDFDEVYEYYLNKLKESPYCSAKYSTYAKTVKTFLEYGLDKPLKFEK